MISHIHRASRIAIKILSIQLKTQTRSSFSHFLLPLSPIPTITEILRPGRTLRRPKAGSGRIGTEKEAKKSVQMVQPPDWERQRSLRERFAHFRGRIRRGRFPRHCQHIMRVYQVHLVDSSVLDYEMRPYLLLVFLVCRSVHRLSVQVQSHNASNVISSHQSHLCTNVWIKLCFSRLPKKIIDRDTRLCCGCVMIRLSYRGGWFFVYVFFYYFWSSHPIGLFPFRIENASARA